GEIVVGGILPRRRAVVGADVEGLIDGEVAAGGALDAPLRHRLAVHQQAHVAALAPAVAVVVELEAYRGLARRQRRVTGEGGARRAEQVVGVGGPDVGIEVQRPAGTVPALGAPHAPGAALGRVDLGGDDVGTVLHGRRRRLRHAHRARAIDEAVAA